MTPIDYNSPAFVPVRESVAARIKSITEVIVSPGTPLEKVPFHRGELAALAWLLTQLSKPQEFIT